MLRSRDAPERAESAPVEVLVIVERARESREGEVDTDIMEPSQVQRSSSLVKGLEEEEGVEV